MDAKHGPLDTSTHGTVDTAMLDRYLAGESSREERGIVEAWLAADTERIQWLGTIRGAMAVAFTTSHADVGRARDLLDQRIKATLLVAESLRQGVFKRQPLRGGAAITSGLLAAAAIIFVWRYSGGWTAKQRAVAESAYTTYATTNGQRATITLPDGNMVTLNVASRLDVPTNYGAGNHVVRLSGGEALFAASHHSDTPLTVVAGAVTVRVLGTRFVVRHYQEDPVTTVVVEEGRVAVGRTVVADHQMVEVDPHGSAQLRPADSSTLTFATGVLTLGVTPMSKAIPELNRWYDADIRLGDPALANQEIKGRFVVGSLSDLAAILELTLDVHVVRNGRILTLSPISR